MKTTQSTDQKPTLENEEYSIPSLSDDSASQDSKGVKHETTLSVYDTTVNSSYVLGYN